MTFAFSTESQDVVVYHYDGTTGEYLATTTDTIPAGTGLPADGTEVAPPDAVDGYARVFSSGSWGQAVDHRGETVYLKATREAVVVTTIGTFVDTVTSIAPTSDYDVWNTETGAWSEDTSLKLAAETEAAVNKKAELMTTSYQQIEILSNAVSLELATDAEVLMLTAWQKYQVLLNRVDTSDPESITWPDVPTEADVVAASEAAATTESAETTESDTSAQA